MQRNYLAFDSIEYKTKSMRKFESIFVIIAILGFTLDYLEIKAGSITAKSRADDVRYLTRRDSGPLH